jgi:molybdate transport system substrate-binding protein
VRAHAVAPVALAAFVVLVAGACSAAGGGAPASLASAAPPSTDMSRTPTPGGSAAPVELTVFGAASLQGVLEEAKAAYEAAHAGTMVVLSTDSSAALETQIEQGAPADVFLSADTTNPQKLVDAGLADGDALVFAGNELTVIVPSGNPAGVAGPADLAKPGLKVIAAGDDVPITRYATQLVDNLAKETGYPSDFAAAYAGNVVSREDNVKAVVTKVELGEGDAGIVYGTDATASGKVETVPIPAGANVQASYAGVVVRASERLEAAHAFLDWLLGTDGQAILATFGFLPPSP